MFPVNTILAWRINIYLEHGNMIIPILLLPLGHISNKFTLVAYLENLPLCQALIENQLKFEVAPIHPPSRCPYDPFNWYQSLGSIFGLYRLREYGYS